MALHSKRSEFERQICSQLNVLSEVIETLAERVLTLEARFEAMEAQQSEAQQDLTTVAQETAELISASEKKVTLLRTRLVSADVLSAHSTPVQDAEPGISAVKIQSDCEALGDESSDDLDNQIDRLAA